MKRFSQNAANKIWNELSINRNEAILDKFMKGLYNESEHGITGTKVNISGMDGKLTDEISWEHLEELRVYYTKLDKME